MTQESLPETRGVEYRSVSDFPAYVVGTDGSVWSRGRKGLGGKSSRTGPWKQLKPTLMSIGYCKIVLCKNGNKVARYIHQIILASFVGPPPPGEETRHLNGNRTDNRLVNLAYGTRKENQHDRVRHKTTNRGERCGSAKLTETQVRDIRNRCKRGERQKAIAAEFSIRKATVSEIVRRKTWCYV